VDFKLTPGAERDAQSISDYYADLAQGLAERFISELVSTLQELCDEPNIGSRRYAHFLPGGTLRSWHLDHFPFIIFYRIDKDGLVVLRILHESRNLSPHLIMA